jgi:hypothetical protein
MSSELNFGPQWLRDTFQGSEQTANVGSTSNHRGGHARYPDDHGRSRGGNGGEHYGLASVSSKLATMKLAEFRYGREEMLAIYDSTLDADRGDPVEKDPPDGFLKQFSHLWVTR